MSVCFYGVYRNEAEHLPAMLDALEPFVDSYRLFEGGTSTDKTASILRAWVKSHDGETQRIERWRGIDRAWTSAMHAAAASGCDYVITCAGGELLRKRARLPKLTADVYHIRQRGEMEWWMPLLVRSELAAAAHWDGPTHSYLVLPAGLNHERLSAIEWEDHAYEDRRPEKLQRDRRLLERHVAKHPTEARWWFYLAQTYRCLGMVPEATAAYAARSHMPEFEEERWYAQYMHAALTGNTHLILKAWQARTQRAEPLRHLARCYAADGDTQVALMFDSLADAIPYPSNEQLFVHATDYKQP